VEGPGLPGRGPLLAAQQKPEAAENYYQRSLGVLETAEGQALLALSKRRLGGPESWEEGARRAYELDSRHPKAVLAMGELHLAHGRKSQALKLFQKANEHTPGSCDILAGLAKSQYLMGQYVASRGTSAQAISRCPGEADAYYYAAVTSDKLRNRKEAEDYFRAYRKAGGDAGRLPDEYR
jgi:tetratricopeptide (TPR) repeat protein